MEKPHFGIGTGIRSGNLAILPQKLAFVFLLFCPRNPKPCPVLEVSEPGIPFSLRLPEEGTYRRISPANISTRKGNTWLKWKRSGNIGGRT